MASTTEKQLSCIGLTFGLHGWAKYLDIPYATFQKRLDRIGLEKTVAMGRQGARAHYESASTYKSPDLEPFDKELETKRRFENYLSQGMKPEAIVMRELSII